VSVVAPARPRPTSRGRALALPELPQRSAAEVSDSEYELGTSCRSLSPAVLPLQAPLGDKCVHAPGACTLELALGLVRPSQLLMQQCHGSSPGQVGGSHHVASRHVAGGQ